eukprot:SAG22_NODE_723_length_7636_cov_75.271726_4_plen_131_part_00
MTAPAAVELGPYQYLPGADGECTGNPSAEQAGGGTSVMVAPGVCEDASPASIPAATAPDSSEYVEVEGVPVLLKTFPPELVGLMVRDLASHSNRHQAASKRTTARTQASSTCPLLYYLYISFSLGFCLYE